MEYLVEEHVSGVSDGARTGEYGDSAAAILAAAAAKAAGSGVTVIARRNGVGAALLLGLVSPHLRARIHAIIDQCALWDDEALACDGEDDSRAEALHEATSTVCDILCDRDGSGIDDARKALDLLLA